MPSTITLGKGRTTALTLQAIAAGTVVAGPAITVATKYGGTVKFRMGRMSTTSMSASLPEFRIEGQSAGHGGADSGWFTIFPWTPANGATVASKVTVASTPGANSTTLDGTWTGITATDGLVFISDTNDATRSEWARISSIATSVATFQRTLTNVHTATSNVVLDQAEEWSIPVSFEGEESIRVVVDLAKNGTASGGITAEAYLIHTTQVDAS